jgi:hypothetical protein
MWCGVVCQETKTPWMRGLGVGLRCYNSCVAKVIASPFILAQFQRNNAATPPPGREEDGPVAAIFLLDCFNSISCTFDIQKWGYRCQRAW